MNPYLSVKSNPIHTDSKAACLPEIPEQLCLLASALYATEEKVRELRNRIEPVSIQSPLQAGSTQTIEDSYPIASPLAAEINQLRARLIELNTHLFDAVDRLAI